MIQLYFADEARDPNKLVKTSQICQNLSVTKYKSETNEMLEKDKERQNRWLSYTKHTFGVHALMNKNKVRRRMVVCQSLMLLV